MFSLLVAAALSIPFSMVNDTPTARHVGFVSVGLPLPEGAARDVNQLRIVGYDELSVAAQLRPLAAWPDGSLRWIHAAFTCNADLGDRQTWTLSTGRSTTRSHRHARVLVEDDVVSIGSGAFRYRIGDWIRGLSVELAEGKGKWLAAPAERLTVEEEGPVRVSVRCDGWLLDGKEKVCRFLERFSVVAGQPMVRVTLRLTPAVDAVIKGAGFDIVPPLRPVKTVTLGRAGGGVSIAAGEARRLEQPVAPIKPISDRQHPGWIDWRGEASGILFGPKWFWQLAPKALDVREDSSVRCELYSTAATPVVWPKGRTLTQEFGFAFHTAGEAFDEALAEMNQPLLAVVKLDQMQSTHAAGEMRKSETLKEPDAVGLMKFGEAPAGTISTEAWEFIRTGERKHWETMVQTARHDLDAGKGAPEELSLYYWMTGDPDAAEVAKSK